MFDQRSVSNVTGDIIFSTRSSEHFILKINISQVTGEACKT